MNMTDEFKVPLYRFKIGDLVVKNPQTWLENEFDGWGRGLGVGEVVEPPFHIDDVDCVDVRWPAGRCFERIDGLLLVSTELE